MSKLQSKILDPKQPQKVAQKGQKAQKESKN